MNRDDRRLTRHLSTAIAVKLAALAVLWWLFVRHVAVDASNEQTAAHLMAPSVPSAAAGGPDDLKARLTNKEEPQK